MAKKTNTTINGKNYFKAYATLGKDENGKLIRKQFYGESKKEAEAKRDAYMFNIKSGLNASYEKLTFASAYKQWFETVHKPTLALSSIIRYERDNKRIYATTFMHMRLLDIRALHIQQSYNDMLGAGHSVISVINMGKLLSAFFKYAVKTDMIIKNPMLAVVKPKVRKIEVEKPTLEKDDLHKIITYAQSHANMFIFVFLAFTGLRQGEAMALTYNDIDFTKGIVRVNKSVGYLYIDGTYSPVVSSTKTTCSTREVPLLENLRQAFDSYIMHEKSKHEKLGVPFDKNSIVFSTDACSYIEAKNLRIRFHRLLKRLDIDIINIHALRHTFCSWLAENGVNIKTASELMGHADVNTTMKIYTHVQQEEKKRSIETLANIFDS